MNLIRSIAIAFSCFSAIPMPQVQWSEKNMRYMMAAFPLVGVVVGISCWLWHLVCLSLGMGFIMHAIGLVLIPMAISGGIHMDGFADVVDALSSHATPEKKREILKDPHIGAFAAMGIACYLLAEVALVCEIDALSLPIACAMPVVSRCLCGFAAVHAHTSSGKGMMASIGGAASSRGVTLVLVALLALASGFMVWQNAIAGIAAITLAVLVLLAVLHMARKEFGGMSGDLLGFYVQVSELTMLAALVCTGRLVA